MGGLGDSPGPGQGRVSEGADRRWPVPSHITVSRSQAGWPMGLPPRALWSAPPGQSRGPSPSDLFQCSSPCHPAHAQPQRSASRHVPGPRLPSWLQVTTPCGHRHEQYYSSLFVALRSEIEDIDRRLRSELGVARPSRLCRPGGAAYTSAQWPGVLLVWLSPCPLKVSLNSALCPHPWGGRTGLQGGVGRLWQHRGDAKGAPKPGRSRPGVGRPPHGSVFLGG